jgi:PleD family two-component response regulator
MSKRIIAVVDDLFFASKIRGTAEQVGSNVVFSRTAEALFESARSDRPSLIIVDLHSQKVDPIGLASNLKADEQLRSIPLVGFFSHVEVELQKTATAAGFDRVMPRSAFVRDLVGLLSTE